MIRLDKYYQANDYSSSQDSPILALIKNVDLFSPEIW